MYFFWLFDLLLGGQNDWFYWIYRILSTFWLFDLSVRVQNDQFYWMYWIFSTFWPLAGRSNWSILLDMLDFVRFFDFSNSCRKIKMIDLTEYIGFFRLFDLLVGGHNDQFYWIYWFFSTSRPLAGMSNWSILLDILDFSTSQALTGRSKWLILLNIIYFIDFSTFRPLGGRSNWLILLNILDVFDFSTLRPVARRSNLLILQNMLIFFNLSICSWELKMINFA